MVIKKLVDINSLHDLQTILWGAHWKMIKLKSNMGTMDRSIRILVGSTLLILGPLTSILDTDTLSNTILAVLGTTAVFSGGFAYCVLYEITGFHTLHY